MKIGIIGAVKEEINNLIDIVKNCQTIALNNGKEIYSGQLYGIRLILLVSGIGKVSSSSRTTILLEHYKPDLIINVGSAGSVVSTLKIGDIVFSEEVCYHDVDVTAFGYELGQIPNFPKKFKADKKLISIVEDCTAKLNIKAHRGLIVSGDTFVNNSFSLEKIRCYFPQAIATEMESAAIAQVCYDFKVPFIVIRIVSDFSDQNSDVDFNLFLREDKKNFSLLLEILIEVIRAMSD